MDRLEQKVERGQHARELLDNPVFEEIWTSYERQLVQALKALDPRDAVGREKGVQALILLDQLKQQVIRAIETGREATLEIASKQTRVERLRSAIGLSG